MQRRKTETVECLNANEKGQFGSWNQLKWKK